MIDVALIQAIRSRYTLGWDGIHGLAHWGRVLENGVRLAEETGADERVVTLFAVFHDAQRENDSYDAGHGRRGAELAADLRGVAFELDEPRFELLCYACIHHTDGRTDGGLTVQTCWDADRLDLGRVFISPAPDLLGTDAARNPAIMNWANRRSTTLVVPDFVTDQWLCADAHETEDAG